MSLATLMLEQLEIARRIVKDGQEVVPAWRISTPEGAFLILTPFDMDKLEDREKAIFEVSKFMRWKMATSFVVTAETWLGGQPTRQDGQALLAVGVSRHERLAVLQQIWRGDTVSFSDAQWLGPYQVDGRYFEMLPTGVTELTAEDEVELARMFGKTGVFPAERVT
jgi:hypothetical protein